MASEKLLELFGDLTSEIKGQSYLEESLLKKNLALYILTFRVDYTFAPFYILTYGYIC